MEFRIALTVVIPPFDGNCCFLFCTFFLDILRDVISGVFLPIGSYDLHSIPLYKGTEPFKHFFHTREKADPVGESKEIGNIAFQAPDYLFNTRCLISTGIHQFGIAHVVHMTCKRFQCLNLRTGNYILV